MRAALRSLIAGAALLVLPLSASAQQAGAEVVPEVPAAPPAILAAPSASGTPEVTPGGQSDYEISRMAQPGQERLVSTLSNRTVSITSSFDGETLTLFGVAEADRASGATHLNGPYHVIVVVVGPLQSRVARLANRNFGVWMNTEQVAFSQVPSFYHVISSGRLDTIIDPALLEAEAIPPGSHLRQSSETDPVKRVEFAAELERLMTEQGRFAVNETGVSFLSETAYTARVTLPHDIVTGPFLARTYLIKDRQIVARRTEGFLVRKVGFERFMGNAANQYPFLYGLVGVLLALGTGWLGGVVFRR
jgi:uncharacterized protein (TIGR02186 family)